MNDLISWWRRVDKIDFGIWCAIGLILIILIVCLPLSIKSSMEKKERFVRYCVADMVNAEPEMDLEEAADRCEMQWDLADRGKDTTMVVPMVIR